jgi:hypothetical protein
MEKESSYKLVKEYIDKLSKKDLKHILEICINKLIEAEDVRVYRKSDSHIKVYDENSGDDLIAM